jgi:hypothetical protein
MSYPNEKSNSASSLEKRNPEDPDQLQGDGPLERTLHRGLKARQVSMHD